MIKPTPQLKTLLYENSLAFMKSVNGSYSHKQSGDNMDAFISSWYDGIKQCQSPIEGILFTELLFITSGFNDINFSEKPLPKHPQQVVGILSCQKKVGKYKADFCIDIMLGGKVNSLIIECDGHDFHEKTKEQAKHDKKRDRYLTANGHNIMRFTGSEIFNEPKKCAEEVRSYLINVHLQFINGWSN